ncbi:hypothetical protein [Streptomyces sp. NPDC005476]|uniref:hypothetical protein n=1 Tax=Streptomyces sp. NPDC005476 TaxID=3156882 RepID=UPI0034533F84
MEYVVAGAVTVVVVLEILDESVCPVDESDAARGERVRGGTGIPVPPLTCVPA